MTVVLVLIAAVLAVIAIAVPGLILAAVAYVRTWREIRRREGSE